MAREKRIRLKLFSREEVSKGHQDVYEQAFKGYSSQQIVDPFQNQYSTGVAAAAFSTVKPTYDPGMLLRLPNESSILRQCIDAYVVNIESYGSRLEYVGEDGQEDTPEAKAEHALLDGLIGSPNEMYSMVELRERLRRDKETLGYAFMEITRDREGNPVMLYHLPASTVRMTSADNEVVPVTVEMERGGKLTKQVVGKRFRRFVQSKGSTMVYFKEFGDPRVIDPVSGRENKSLPFEKSATEIYHFGQYSPGEVYGLPRWVSQMPSILGLRESEMNNLQFFKDNAIPAMAVLVSGGMLTEDATDMLEEKFNNARGRGSMNRVLVLEATGDVAGAAEDGKVAAPKIEVKPLASERQSDGSFQEYELNAAKKVRSSFRLPPLFVGLSEEMTYAVAQASLTMAEAQVFGPERRKVDEIFNQHFLRINGEQPKYWRMRSLPPRITNPDDVLKALTVMMDVGAVSPNDAIGIANELFDLKISTVAQEWAGYPFSVALALLAAGTHTFDYKTGSFVAIEPSKDVNGKEIVRPKKRAVDAKEAVSAGVARDGVVIRKRPVEK